MNKPLPLEYHYGNEAEQYSFYRIPKMLFTAKRFKSVSAEAKILYGLMLDRMSLSIRNGWFDMSNRVYIYFTLEDAMGLLGCGHSKIVALFAELDINKGVGLIERKKQGQGKPTIIYVKNFATVSKAEDEPPNEPVTGDIKTSENKKFVITLSPTFQANASALDDNFEFPTAEEVKTSQNRKSAHIENGSLDFPKSAASNTNVNDTDFNDTESSSSRPQIDFSTTKTREDEDEGDLAKLRIKTEYEYFSDEMPDKLSLIDILLNIISALQKEDNPQYRRLLFEVDACTIMEFLDEMKTMSLSGVRNLTAYLRKVFLEFIIKRDLQLSMI